MSITQLSPYIPPAIAAAAYFATPIAIKALFQNSRELRNDKALNHVINVDIKDNLPLSLFIVSLAALKNRDCRDPWVILLAPFILCRLFSRVRQANSDFFTFTATRVTPNGAFHIACKALAALTQPSEVIL